jgi:chromosome segregation ATPase
MSIELLIFIYVSVSAAVSGGFVAYFKFLGDKKKSVNSAFNDILSANERFRNEVREDLESSRQESERLRVDLVSVEEKYKLSIEQIADLQKIIIEYQGEITELKQTIVNYQGEIGVLKAVIDDYKIEVEKLRKEIGRLNDRS